MFPPQLPPLKSTTRFPRIRGDVPRSQISVATVNRFSPHTRGCSQPLAILINRVKVFPAYAGMFPLPKYHGHAGPGFPRIRGDVPLSAFPPTPAPWFSPHTRGCSGHHQRTADHQHVFPAYAGMFRCLFEALGGLTSFPRIRGDVPQMKVAESPLLTFSPHTRGCSLYEAITSDDNDVFPAYAGMFPVLIHYTSVLLCFPRIRGDVPARNVRGKEIAVFSPHTRGCSFLVFLPGFLNLVFPAYAGMFRFGEGFSAPLPRFPRIRGDVPIPVRVDKTDPPFSPHTRGCSFFARRHEDFRRVFPAYAGMFRLRLGCARLLPCFPRIRGDIPLFHLSHFGLTRFSPHTRGCSDFRQQEKGTKKVFPAYAGMFQRQGLQ